VLARLHPNQRSIPGDRMLRHPGGLGSVPTTRFASPKEFSMEQPSAVNSATIDQHPDGIPVTILIVDDSPENLTMLAQCLNPTYRVRAVKSGAGALRAAVTDPNPTSATQRRFCRFQPGLIV
jgi:hypothetical protein